MAEQRKGTKAKGMKNKQTDGQGARNIWPETGSAKGGARRKDEKGLPQHLVSPSIGFECRHLFNADRLFSSSHFAESRSLISVSLAPNLGMPRLRSR
jgi:hypothetical protein